MNERRCSVSAGHCPMTATGAVGWAVPSYWRRAPDCKPMADGVWRRRSALSVPCFAVLWSRSFNVATPCPICGVKDSMRAAASAASQPCFDSLSIRLPIPQSAQQSLIGALLPGTAPRSAFHRVKRDIDFARKFPTLHDFHARKRETGQRLESKSGKIRSSGSLCLAWIIRRLISGRPDAMGSHLREGRRSGIRRKSLSSA
jgi:hypothetical protein